MINFSFAVLKHEDKSIKIKEVEDFFNAGSTIQLIQIEIKKYLDNVLDSLKREKVVDSIIYNGQIGRIDRHKYDLVVEDRKYELIMTHDTLEGNHYLEVQITNLEYCIDSYDSSLERIKITLKNALIKNWSKCIWIHDEQSEKLASLLYTKMHSVENLLRELINKVLIRELGVNWLEKVEFYKIKEEYKSRTVDFKRTAASFNNIDDSLISINTDSLIEIMKTIIYDDEIPLSLGIQTSIRLKQNVLESKPAIFNGIRGLLKVKLDLWNDVFKRFFKDDFLQNVNELIKNRNHIAHNKLVDFHAYEKINNNITDMEDAIKLALSLVNEYYMSDQVCETLEIEEQMVEEQINKNDIELEVKMLDAGINILKHEEIYKLFAQSIQKLYSGVSDNFYFSEIVKVSNLSMSDDLGSDQVILSVSNNVNVDDTLSVAIDLNIDDSEGQLSTMNIKLLNRDEIIYESSVAFINGEAAYNEEQGYYLPVVQDEYDDKGIDAFSDYMIDFIKNDMNTLKKTVDSMNQFTEIEENMVVLEDSPCYSCGEEYISIDDSIYPYGKCINCGAENNINECFRCERTYNKDVEGTDKFCDICLDYFRNQ